MDMILLSGRLGRNPEQRFTQEGVPVTNFSLAVDRSYSKRDGTKVKETVWYRISAWRRLAETCNEYLAKGRQVLVTGQLSGDKVDGKSGTIIVPRVYEANDGTHKAQFEVTARSVEFLGSRGDAGPSDVGSEDEAEEIPFD